MVDEIVGEDLFEDVEVSLPWTSLVFRRTIYCAAYGSGNFIVRGFGPDAFQLNGRREASDAVHKAAGVGQSVTQEICDAGERR